MKRVLLGLVALAVGIGVGYWVVTSQMAAMERTRKPSERPAAKSGAGAPVASGKVAR